MESLGDYQLDNYDLDKAIKIFFKNYTGGGVIIDFTMNDFGNNFDNIVNAINQKFTGPDIKYSIVIINVIKKIIETCDNNDLEFGIKNGFYEIAILFCNHIWNSDFTRFNEELFTYYYNSFLTIMSEFEENVTTSFRPIPVSYRTRNSLIQNICGICRENYENEAPYQLGCGHIFHQGCLEQWQISGSEQSFYCPVCRGYMLEEMS